MGQVGGTCESELLIHFTNCGLSHLVSNIPVWVDFSPLRELGSPAQETELHSIDSLSAVSIGFESHFLKSFPLFPEFGSDVGKTNLVLSQEKMA